MISKKDYIEMTELPTIMKSIQKKIREHSVYCNSYFDRIFKMIDIYDKEIDNACCLNDLLLQKYYDKPNKIIYGRILLNSVKSYNEYYVKIAEYWKSYWVVHKKYCKMNNEMRSKIINIIQNLNDIEKKQRLMRMCNIIFKKQVYSEGFKKPSIGETLVMKSLDALAKKYSLYYFKEYEWELCRDKKRLRYDFYCIMIYGDRFLHWVIEFDGDQHFDNDISIFNFKYTHIHDILKQYYLVQMNIPLLRLNNNSAIGESIVKFMNQVIESDKYVRVNPIIPIKEYFTSKDLHGGLNYFYTMVNKKKNKILEQKRLDECKREREIIENREQTKRLIEKTERIKKFKETFCLQNLINSCCAGKSTLTKTNKIEPLIKNKETDWIDDLIERIINESSSESEEEKNIAPEEDTKLDNINTLDDDTKSENSNLLYEEDTEFENTNLLNEDDTKSENSDLLYEEDIKSSDEEISKFIKEMEDDIENDSKPIECDFNIVDEDSSDTITRDHVKNSIVTRKINVQDTKFITENMKIMFKYDNKNAKDREEEVLKMVYNIESNSDDENNVSDNKFKEIDLLTTQYGSKITQDELYILELFQIIDDHNERIKNTPIKKKKPQKKTMAKKKPQKKTMIKKKWSIIDL